MRIARRAQPRVASECWPRTRTWKRLPLPLARCACIEKQLPWSTKLCTEPEVSVQSAWDSIWLAARPHVPHVVNTTLIGSTRFWKVAGHPLYVYFELASK
jgi:hypothetical protein